MGEHDRFTVAGELVLDRPAIDRDRAHGESFIRTCCSIQRIGARAGGPPPSAHCRVRIDVAHVPCSNGRSAERACAARPELDVGDLDASLQFYVGVIGFTIVFQRPRERFAYLALEHAELMLQDADGPGRRFRTAPLERPFGRGINLQVAVRDVDELHETVLAAGLEPVIPIEERWYDVDVTTPSGRWTMRGPTRAGNRQFVIADPDGYLLRFFTSLGARPISRTALP